MVTDLFATRGYPILFILYYPGGRGNGAAEKDIYMYDLVSNTWKVAGKMTTGRRGHSVALRDEDS